MTLDEWVEIVAIMEPDDVEAGIEVLQKPDAWILIKEPDTYGTCSFNKTRVNWHTLEGVRCGVTGPR